MNSPAAKSNAEEQIERCELCVVGAGIGGLNAIFAASRYLSPQDRVLLIDRRPRVGGMWTTAYHYVRLHQPHPMFTAGNIAWQWSKPGSHLANREEVLVHLQHCFEDLKKRVDLELHHGYDYDGYEEDDARGVVSIRCSSTEPGRPPLRIEAKRLIDARGFGITPKDPLPLSSKQVTSVSPDLMSADAKEFGSSEAPIYVVGGGKTGMDTAHNLIQRFPERSVHLLIGAGTIFMDRDQLYPQGLRRYYGGTVGGNMFLDLAQRFDGDNESAVTDRFRERYGLALDPACQHHMFGTISRAENEAIQRGAKEVLLDYLVDVVDRDGAPTMVLRSGREQPVEPGSVFVNATGYFNESAIEYQPFASKSERILAINPRSAVTFLPAYTGYLLVDAAYRASLARLPIYEVDSMELRKLGKGAFMPTMVDHILHNLVHLLDGMPMAAQREFGPNFTLWFPLYRQIGAGLSLMRFQKSHPDHLRSALDRVSERFGVRLGPLSHSS